MRYEGSNESRNWQEEERRHEGQSFSMWVHGFKFASSYRRLYADGSKTINIVITVNRMGGTWLGRANAPLHMTDPNPVSVLCILFCGGGTCGDLTVEIILMVPRRSPCLQLNCYPYCNRKKYITVVNWSTGCRQYCMSERDAPLMDGFGRRRLFRPSTFISITTPQ
jgi:hypothetical protein